MINQFLLVFVLFLPAISLADSVRDAFVVAKKVIRLERKIPVAVFDLDETLIDSTPRRYLSWRETMPSLSLQLEDIENQKNRYDNVGLLNRFGILVPEQVQQQTTAMLKTYLSGRYIEFDREVPCASRFVNELMDLGVKIVFISSRYESSQGDATLKSLRRLGFLRPGAETEVFLRPDGMESITFKRESIRRVTELQSDGRHQVALLFENEPENMNAWMSALPRASAWFIDLAFIKEEPLQGDVRVLQNYCR